MYNYFPPPFSSACAQGIGRAMKIAVLGAGAWGTALAWQAAQNAHEVVLWLRDAKQADEINRVRENKKRLAGVTLPQNITATNDKELLQGAEAVIIALPAQSLQIHLRELCPVFAAGVPFFLASKGIDQQNGVLLSRLIEIACPENPVGVLSGPSFARDLTSGRPVALTLAMTRMDEAMRWSHVFGTTLFRLYASDDVIGAQVGGAVKNVMAIACGIVDALELGESARAGLITRALAEMARLTRHFGGKSETLMGLSGIGDLMLSCTSKQSRNYSFGFNFVEAGSAEKVLENAAGIAEGYYTTKALQVLAEKARLDMPIAAGVYDCLYAGKPVKEVIHGILSRAAKEEGA
ncbi:MAG: NAD(P)H-dependent glycerol-3-phosphate dehydrogenase [Alphaproteobacteria bacterium]|nr:NAD(P)H-dependent glycerol-3-phosphate dehydrogenase [Alphaproteobacteria bacterium]